jgi:hypothetical protein
MKARGQEAEAEDIYANYQLPLPLNVPAGAAGVDAGG